jgi:small-conductance mechanosensitive channel
MLLQTMAEGESAVEQILSELVDGVIAAVPKLILGLVFLTLAYLVISGIRRVLRVVLRRVYAGEQQLIADLGVAVASLFLWFGAGLTLLKIVGMGEIAATLGTASGFIALGVAFALKEMIADTVAGVYLLRDPDFNEGDLVTTASVTGTVTGIGLRKTRIRTDEGDLVVLANGDVDKKWTQESRADPASSPESG